MRKLLTGIVVIGLVATCVQAFATVGARPLAMGGAFIGLADDANATYWNPAGLAQMTPGQASGTWMHTSNHRKTVNYQEFGSMVACTEAPKIDKIAFGASYIKDDVPLHLGDKLATDTQSWIWGSLAVDTGKYGMIGVNVRKMDDSAPGYSVTSDNGIDIGYLYRVDSDLTFGMLIQDVNKPETRIAGFDSTKKIRNMRMGLAYRPTRDTIVTLDGYDLADDANARSARFGFEKSFGQFAVRGGYYGLGDDNNNSGATVGIGIKNQSVTIDATLMMGDFDDTLMISGTYISF